ncbi:hypothetical protein [Streptomyces niveus]|uniref:hypothetical protein n=1 Tax=Streptomyces niveus TaxID=193462 RepID=UPI00379C4148
MSEPANPAPDVPPLDTIPDAHRVPPPRRPAPPRPEPISLTDDIPPVALFVMVVIGMVGFVSALNWVLPEAMSRAQSLDWTWASQWAATVSDPVHAYLQSHTVGLPITAATVYTLWQAVGIGSLAIAFVTRANGARLTWIAYGAATAVMVWIASPAAGREVAAALSVFAWTIASTLALRGLGRRRPALPGGAGR